MANFDDRTNYEKASDALDEAWDTINDPPGQAIEAEQNRLPWADTMQGIGLGFAMLALVDELKERR